MYVVISGDTISFYEKQFYEQFRFVFPLTIGNKWDTNIGDANVTSNETLQINSLNKYYSYKVTIYPTHWGNAGGNQLYFISPGVGIVRFDNSIFETDISQRYHTVWELRYFHRG
jgi:hypothetical protein